jgi:hypothetical protein
MMSAVGPQGEVTATAAAFCRLRDRVEVVDPRLLRANKQLPAQRQFVALANDADPDGVSLWIIAKRTVQRSP